MSTQRQSLRPSCLLFLIVLSLCTKSCTSDVKNSTNVSLTGAGATFPAPLYQGWFAMYNQQHPNVKINYQSIGSGTGISQFIQGTVDFAASDVAITEEQAAQVKRGAIALPMTAGAIVIAYNLPKVATGLKLSRAVYTDIFLGKIKTWNDPKIATLNPGVQLPDLPILVVHRSDGSGTTSVFTQHLNAISPEWKNKVGAGKAIAWPIGIGAKGNEGVTAHIQQLVGTIGYIEYSYAMQNNLSVAALENKAGRYIMPTLDSAAQTLEKIELPSKNLIAFITDPADPQSYPIVTYTWLLSYQKYQDPQKAQVLKNFVDWALTTGQKYSTELGYIPLPQEVVTQVKSAAGKISE
ncbi:phosphate ABC transporter substrate-binding protein PstS [Scytonema sp. UIC 10036]|uniref:phosphate ABC transporter substrate-binding protein PstS n=1 Tax=Scytonema sp. UIC 10036 TaxID=2304196 RepID=UPI0012DA472C|nr:phosphate ABC transporter substrate-binding protein PstS [Scytonema sp. UIC 10036]MUG96892.1 phosphate ABC transporter substrate-binding protein PstS [Scytonema sp. UIC 10036]